MLKSVLRLPRISSANTILPNRLAISAVRFNSTNPDPIKPTSPKAKEQDLSGSSPSDADQIAEEWIRTLRNMRNEIQSEGYTKLEKPKTDYVEKYGIEPTTEQIAKAESLAGKPIPAKNDPIVEHCTNMIMKDGKKARAQKIMGQALYIVKLQLRKDPIEVLKEILEKMSPLMAIKTHKTRAAKSVILPVPLTQRQRQRTAFLWILEGAAKRRSPDFSVRLGEELIAAYEGRSSGYEKRLQIHKTAMLQRAYVKVR